MGDDVIAHQPYRIVDVERVLAARAEIPAFARRPGKRAIRPEDRAEVTGFAAILVVAEERRPAAAAASIEAEEDQHRVAAGVVVDIAPIGVADVVDAVAAAAVAGIGDAGAD